MSDAQSEPTFAVGSTVTAYDAKTNNTYSGEIALAPWISGGRWVYAVGLRHVWKLKSDNTWGWQALAYRQKMFNEADIR